jgi:hypothetical protein
LRAELRRLRSESERADDPFRLVFRVAGADAEVVRQYADAGFEEVLVWTDQVWPSSAPLDEQRAAIQAAADSLGVAG